MTFGSVDDILSPLKVKGFTFNPLLVKISEKKY